MVNIMIVTDEWVLGAFAGIAAYFGYLLRYMLTEMRCVVEKNTSAIQALIVSMEARK